MKMWLSNSDVVVLLAAFVVLLVSSWDWMWREKSRKPSARGYILLVSGMIGVFFGWFQYRNDADERTRLLESIEREGSRLLPSDFQVKLETYAHANAVIASGGDYDPPERVDLSMSIDKIYITGDFVRRPDPAREFPLGRNPGRFWNYYATDLFVEGLGELSYGDELEGKTLRLYIPRRALGKPFAHPNTHICAYISIKGREFEVEQKGTESGFVEIPISWKRPPQVAASPS